MVIRVSGTLIHLSTGGGLVEVLEGDHTRVLGASNNVLRGEVDEAESVNVEVEKRDEGHELSSVVGDGTEGTEDDSSNDDQKNEQSEDSKELETEREVRHGVARRDGTEDDIREPEEVNDEQEDHYNVEDQKGGLSVDINTRSANLGQLDPGKDDNRSDPEESEHDELGQVESAESLQLGLRADSVEHNDPEEHEQDEEGGQQHLIQEGPESSIEKYRQGEDRIVVAQ